MQTFWRPLSPPAFIVLRSTPSGGGGGSLGNPKGSLLYKSYKESSSFFFSRKMSCARC